MRTISKTFDSQKIYPRKIITRDKNDSQFSELLLFGVSSNNDASNTCILNANIIYILATKRFDTPRINSKVV